MYCKLIASESNYVEETIPRFDGHYDHQSMLMETFLRSKKYQPIVEVGNSSPVEGETLTNAQATEFEATKLKGQKPKNYRF